MTPKEFWSMTYGEFITMVDGYRRTCIRKHNEMIYEAWHIAAFFRQRQLPELSSLMQSESDEPGQQDAMTDDQMLVMVRMLNAAYGGTEIEVCNG